MIRKLSFVILLILSATKVAAEAPHVAGWIETAKVFPQDFRLEAKLDTGARTSSINATDIVEFTKDGDDWVRFDITNRYDESITIERPIIRKSKVRRHFGKLQVRDVIELELCVGSVRKTTDVSLIDRSGLNYQLLIGRRFLAGSLLIDSANKNLLDPDCK